MERKKMKKWWAWLLSALIGILAVTGSAGIAFADETASDPLPDWAEKVAVAGKTLSETSGWTAQSGYWTCDAWGVPGIERVVVYAYGQLDIVVDGDVALADVPLVDAAGVDDLRLVLNVDFPDDASNVSITRSDQGPALVVGDTDKDGIDCTMFLEPGSADAATCRIDGIDVETDAVFQVVYQERAYHKSSMLEIGRTLEIADGASFNAWAIGNSYLTVSVDEGATVENSGTMAISGTELDNNGTIRNNGSLSVEVAGFNNHGTVENNGTVRLHVAMLINNNMFNNHAAVEIGNAASFENAGGTVNNGDTTVEEQAAIAIEDGGKFVNDAASVLENHAPVTLDDRGSFENDDLKDTHCDHHCFAEDAAPSYTVPQTCYVCEQRVYERDTIAPTGALSINGVAYTDLSCIGDVISVNPGAPVALTAQDGQSGIKRLFYYVSDRALSAEEIAALTDWQTITLDEASSATVSIGPDPVQEVAGHEQFAVYIRIEDDAGHGVEGASDNVTYLGAPLCQVDAAAPVVEGLVDGGNYTGDVIFTVSDADGNTVSVTLDGTALSPNDEGAYVIAADNRTHTVVVTSGTHTLTYTVTVNTPSEENPGQEPNEPVLVLNKIYARPSTGGTLNLSQEFAAAGQNVYVTVTPENNHVLAQLNIVEDNGHSVSYETTDDGRVHFVMPAADVYVEADFVASSTPEDPDAFPFIDVKNGDWFYDDVYKAWKNGLVYGMTEDLYMPQRAMSRAMTVTILSRFETEIATVPGPWYESARVWGMENGICDGTAMEANVSREQLATMLWRYANHRGWEVHATDDLSAFNDADQISAYADVAMRWAVGSGIIGGKGEGVLDPGGDATRAEFAAMLNRFCDQYGV